MQKKSRIHIRHTKISSLFFVLSSVFLILFQVVVATFQPQKVSADTSAEMTSNLTQYSEYAALRSCLLVGGVSGVPHKVTEDSSAATDYTLPYSTSFADALNFSGKSYWAGIGYIAPGGGDDGKLDCGDIAKQATTVLGMSNDDLMVAVGFEKIQGSGTASTWSYINHANVSNTNNYVNIAAGFTSAVSAKGIMVEEPSYGYYFLAHAALLQGCGASKVASPTATQATSGSTGADGYWYIKEPNAAGTAMEEVLYQIAVGNQGKTIYPYPRPDEKDGEKSKTSCKDVIYALDSTAADRYSTSLAAQNATAGLKAAAQVYADGTGTGDSKIAGLCANASQAPTFGASGGAGASAYSTCVAAIQSCIQTITLGDGAVQYTYRDMPGDTFAKCFSKKVESKQSDVAATFTRLQDAANAAADGAATPLSTTTNTVTDDPCASIPAGTPMSWLACSIFTAVSTMTKSMSGLMQTILYTDPKSFFGDQLRSTSNVFRNLALTLIVIAGLIMVVAQATGTDLINAYTIKKVLPKLGVAVVGIAISWPLLKFAVGLSNDLGGVVNNLFDGIAQAGSGAKLISGASDDFGAILATAAAGGTVAAALGFWGAILLVISLLISYITGLIVLLMQKLLLVVLVVIAPLAIASYVLPGTEKFWKMWKSNFFRVIILYFVIMVMVKVGDALAGIIINGTTGTADATKTILAILAKVATLVLTFKAPQFAGQILGGITGMISGAAYKMAGGLKAPVDKARQQTTAKHQQYYKDLAGQKVLQGRYNTWNSLKDRNDIGSKLLRRAVGGHNIEAEVSAANAKYAEAMDRQIATGPDSLIRAYSIDKSVSESRLDKNGNKEFKSLGGAWFKESMVDDAHRAFGSKNSAAFQKSLTYEMQKALTQEDQDNIVNNYGDVARARGFNNTELGEIWTGSAFAKQNENRQWKHYSWDDQGRRSVPRMKGLNLMREIDEKQGNYAMMQQNADTWTTMGAEMQHAHDVLTGKQGAVMRVGETEESLKETLERGSRIAFATKSASMATVPANAVSGGDSGAQGGSGQTIGGREIGAGAAGRVQQEMMAFVQIADGITQGSEHHYDATSNSGHFEGDAAGHTELKGQDSRNADQGDIGARTGSR